MRGHACMHISTTIYFQATPTSIFTTGTGKTLLARAVASQLDCNFLKVVASAIVDKYIGESARLIREMFGEGTLLGAMHNATEQGSY